jgi:hypothetical protein
MQIDDQQIRKYLLGSIPEHEDDEISLRVIADEDFTERLDHAENELVEDYLDGLLSDNDARLFRENFLTSPERGELLREIRLFRTGFSPAMTARQVVETKPSKRSFFSFFSPPMLAAVGLLLVLSAGFSVWYAFLRDGRTPLEIEYASLNRDHLGDPAKTSGLYTISIIPTNFRDTNSTASHPASQFTNSVVFRLALMVPEPEGTEYEVLIKRSGSSIFTVPGRVCRNEFGSELRFMAPKDILTRGQYEIEVTSADKRGSNATYQLRIE